MFAIIDYLAKRPFLISAIGCTIISVLGYHKPFVLIPVIILLMLVATLTLVLKLNSGLTVAAVFMIAVSISALWANGRANTLDDGEELMLHTEFVVCDVKYQSEKFCIAEAELLQSGRLKKGTKINLYYYSDCLEMGDIASATLKIEKITDNDFMADSFSKGVYFSAQSWDISVSNTKRDLVLKCVQRVRGYIKKTLFDNLGFSEASTLCAILFGETGYFTNDFSSAVKAAGVSHIMVVSGMHLAIIVTFITRLGERLFYNRYVRALIQFTVVILMTALCGFTMSMLRAGITYILASIGLVIGRNGRPENSLGAAVVLILIGSPFAVFSLALQLSVLSTFGILAVALPIIDYINDNKLIKSKLILAVFSAALVTLSATLLTLPVVINTFGWVSTVAVISNLAISYAVTLCLVLGLSALVLELFLPFIARCVFSLVEQLVRYINYVIKMLGGLEFSVAELPKCCAHLAVVLIALIFSALLACKKRNDMLKLEEMRKKIIKEGGGALKWQ